MWTLIAEKGTLVLHGITEGGHGNKMMFVAWSKFVFFAELEINEFSLSSGQSSYGGLILLIYVNSCAHLGT
jgi:hypothetical protein